MDFGSNRQEPVARPVPLVRQEQQVVEEVAGPGCLSRKRRRGFGLGQRRGPWPAETKVDPKSEIALSSVSSLRCCPFLGSTILTLLTPALGAKADAEATHKTAIAVENFMVDKKKFIALLGASNPLSSHGAISQTTRCVVKTSFPSFDFSPVQKNVRQISYVCRPQPVLV